MRLFLSRFPPELTPVSKRERLRSAAGARVGIQAGAHEASNRPRRPAQAVLA